LRMTTEVPNSKLSFVHDHHFGGNPLLSMLCNISSCFTLSEAFSK
jgi:hypothetical protein